MPSEPWKRPSLRSVIDGLAAVAMIIAAGVLIYSNWPSRNTVTPAIVGDLPETVSLAGAHTKGSPRAKLAMVEYSEFECPFCGTFARDTLPKVLEAYVNKGELLIAFKHLPINARHSRAERAAHAAECAASQGKFWEFHQSLFDKQTQLDDDSFLSRSRALGMESPKFEACMSGEQPPRIEEDIASGRELPVSGTPTFFIGDLRDAKSIRVRAILKGAKPFQDFKKILDSLLADTD